jgi:hypothetical protein
MVRVFSQSEVRRTGDNHLHRFGGKRDVERISTNDKHTLPPFSRFSGSPSTGPAWLPELVTYRLRTLASMPLRRRQRTALFLRVMLW